MTVAEAVSGVCEQLGLAKSLPGTGGAAVDYAIEEVQTAENSGDLCTCSLLLKCNLVADDPKHLIV